MKRFQDNLNESNIMLVDTTLRDGEQTAGAVSYTHLDVYKRQKLALQTLLGSARMAEKMDFSISDLKNMVTSPGGTTMAALKVFEENAFRGTIINAMARAADRAEELEDK